MWSGSNKEEERIWRPNHFIPLLDVARSNPDVEVTAHFQTSGADQKFFC